MSFRLFDFDLPQSIGVMALSHLKPTIAVFYRHMGLFIIVRKKEEITEKFILGFIKSCKREQGTYKGYMIYREPRET
jgi:hypothetical protein